MHLLAGPRKGTRDPGYQQYLGRATRREEERYTQLVNRLRRADANGLANVPDPSS
jgi:hypothetical protein